MDDETAIDGLKRLGLTTYEARVFIALQKLGTGAASEISDVADVPRSQVYGAADGLESRGLVEIQQSTPTIYRPVPLDQARSHLLEQLERTGTETFDYLDSIRETADQTERSESIWILRGGDSINSRAADLADQATQRVLYAVDEPSALSSAVLSSFESAAERGITIVLASADDAVLEVAPDEEWLVTFEVPPDRDLDVNIARLLLVDDQTMLLSTLSSNGHHGTVEEVAFWTSDNAFAEVLGELAEAWMHDPFE